MDIPRTPKKRKWSFLGSSLLGACALAAVIIVAMRVRPAAPTVERGTIWTDTVKRGTMVREVLGQGTLVPEEIHWLSAKAPARVERLLVQPGSPVQADTVILELANDDVQLQALEAERQLTQAQAELANLEASLNAAMLAQQSVISNLESEIVDARRREHADDELASRGYLSALEQGQSQEHARALSNHLSFEEKRLLAQRRGGSAQVDAHKEQIERLRSIAKFREQEVEALRVRAHIDGVLQEMLLQAGQSVAAGTVLAKVIRPNRLKAELKVPETQAADIDLGQSVRVDTRNGVAHGQVARIYPAAQSGTVRLDVTLVPPLPPGARPDLNVDGTVEIERLEQVLHVATPAGAEPGTRVSLFRVGPEKDSAHRASVRIGRGSAKNVEIVQGLQEGDEVIVSDVSEWTKFDRLRLR